MDDWTPPTWIGVPSGVAWRFLVVVAAIAVLLAGLLAIGVIVMPMILGIFFATVLWPLSERLRIRGWRPGLAAFACVLVVGVSFGLLAVVSVKALVGPWPEFSAKISAGADELESQLSDVFDGDLSDTPAAIRDGLGEAIGLLLHGAVEVLTVAMSLASTLMLSLLVLFFYLRDGQTIWGAAASLAGRRAALIDRVGGRMWDAVRSFLVGTAAVAAVDAVGIGLGALIIGVPSVASIALITFFLAFVPYFGAIFAGALACLIAIGDGGLSAGIAMAVVVLIVQQVESNLLQPFLVGRSTRLHPLVVALGVIAGGAIAGVVGMFLAIPTIAAAVAALAELRRSAAAAAPVTSTAPTGEATS